VKEFELYVPLSYNDGSAIEDEKIECIGERLLQFFQGLTFYPQRNRGYWKMGGVTFRDEIVLFRVLSEEVRAARRFLRRLKEDLKRDLRQREILVIERTVAKL
jgi:hypothetical protein